MRMAYGEGIVVAILVPFVLYLFRLIRLADTLFLVLLLFGAWSIVSAFVLARFAERNYFILWGLIVSCASTIFVIPLNYAIGLILVAIIASVFLYIGTRRSAPRQDMKQPTVEKKDNAQV